MNVSAVLVTRGDVDLSDVLMSLKGHGFDEIVVWVDGDAELNAATQARYHGITCPNRFGRRLQVYGRYAAVGFAKHAVIYTQDDDCLVDAASVITAFTETDEHELLVNVPAGEKPWLAWGAVFPAAAARVPFEAFRRASGFREGWAMPEPVLRWADVVFAAFMPWRAADLGHVDLPHAFAANRMYRQPDHYSSQEAVEQKCVELGGTVRRA